MITAHLPSGYIVGRTAQRYGVHPWLMPAAVIGGVVPDLDLIWFYFVDGRAFHHHEYWVHIPGFWLAVALVTFPVLRATRPNWRPPARAFFAAVFIHIFLDGIAGGVKWLWPFSDRMFEMVTVPATHDFFVWSFVFHWTFSLELMIWALAIYLYFKDYEP